MSDKRTRRLEKERAAADFIEKNHPKLAEVFEDVARDLGEELVGLSKATRRARQAAEMAHRLDQMVDLSGLSPIAEALDYFGFFLASLGFLAIVDGIEAAAKRRKERATKLREKLEEKGDRISAIAKRRITRRIARLEAKR